MATLISGGCQYAHNPGYSTKKPRNVDLVGVWEPTSKSIADMKTRGNYKVSIHQLILHSNGNFSMTNMPDCVFSGWSAGWDAGHGKFKSGNGKWRINTFQYGGQKIWNIDFTFNSKMMGSLPSIPEPNLIYQNNSYLLHFGFGDLDFGHSVNFAKKDR